MTTPKDQDKLRGIAIDTIGAFVLPSDTISGVFFRKFVAEYRKYDAKQKEYIHQMQDALLQQETEIQQLRDDNERYVAALNGIIIGGSKSKDKQDRQRSQIAALISRIHQLKNKIRDIQEAQSQQGEQAEQK